MTHAQIVGWSHSRFGKSEQPDTEHLIAEILAPALDHAGIGAEDVDGIFVGVFNGGFSRQDFQGAMSRRSAMKTPARPVQPRCMARWISSKAGAGGSRWWSARKR